MKRTPLKRKGGRRFPKRHDPAYWRWCGLRIASGWMCDGCGTRWAQQRAHLIPRSRGGYDRGNIALLCGTCHPLQEKRTDRFVEETGVDLYAKAAAHDRDYTEETGRPREPARK